MIYRTGRYSGYLRPISYMIDLGIIHILAYHFFSANFHFVNYMVFITIAWIIFSIRSHFYEIYRFTRLTTIFSLVGKQGVLFALLVFSFFGFYRELQVDPLQIFRYILLVILLTAGQFLCIPKRCLHAFKSYPVAFSHRMTVTVY